MFTQLIKIASVSALAGLSLVSAQASARTAHMPMRVHVTTTGLDLATVEGRSAAEERVREAAREVCKAHAEVSYHQGEECFAAADRAGQRQLGVILAQRASEGQMAAR